MAFINLAGTLLDPNSEFAVGDKVRFTHESTTGETVKGAVYVLTIPPDGMYDIDLQFGLVLVEYKDARKSHYENRGVATVNGTNPATSIPELLNALVPVSSAELIEFQAILADCVTEADRAEDAADISEAFANQLTTAELISSTAIYAADVVIKTSGFTVSGSGSGSWKQNGVTGQTASQTPSQLVDGLLNDANGNQWALVLNGVVDVLAVGVNTSETALQQHDAFVAAIAAIPATGAEFNIPTNSYSIDISTGNCNLDFDGKSNVVIKGNGSTINWFNSVRGGNHTGGRFKTEDGMRIYDLNLDGQIFTLTEANTLSLWDGFNYGAGIQRGFYVQSNKDVKLINCNHKHFRHFGLDVTGTSAPTRSDDIALTNISGEDSFAYNNAISSIVRVKGLQIDGYTARYTAASGMSGSEQQGLDLEPATTNGQSFEGLALNNVNLEACVLTIITTEENLTVDAAISNVTCTNPENIVGAGFGIVARGYRGVFNNIRIADGGKYLINAPDNKGVGTLNTQTNNYRVDFNNIQLNGSQPSKNLIKNGDFATLDNWTTTLNTGNEILNITASAQIGTNLLHMEVNNVGSGTGLAINQVIPSAKPDTHYTCGVWAKSSGESAPSNPANVNIQVDFRDSGNVVIEQWLYQISQVGQDVFDKTIAVIKSPPLTDNIRVFIVADGANSANAVADFDGIFLYEGVEKDYFTGTFDDRALPASRIITSQQTLNIASVPANDSVVIVRALTGAVVGDTVTVNKPNEVTHAKISYEAVVTANDTIDLFAYNCTVGAINPNSATFSFTIIKH